MKVNMIFGSPGTGKTTRLLQILEELLKEYSPNEIAYVSYTREGAYQGKNRAKEKFNFKDADFPYFATLHSIAFKSLKLKVNDVIGKYHYKKFSEKTGLSFTGYYTEDLRNDDDKYLFYDSLYRNNQKTALNYLEDMDIKMLEFVRNNYKMYKQSNRIIDYTDMIDNFCKENKPIPVKIAIIDEAQDLTTLQWTMVWSAFRLCDIVYIAGDDDQAIYQWSGADVNYFLSINADHTEILQHSHRLPNEVLRFSKRITSKISKRVDKNFSGTGKKGFVDCLASLKEIKFDKEQTYMFLSRNNIFLNGVESFIRNKGLIYHRKGKLSIDKKDYNAILLYEKIRKSKIMTPKEEQTLKPHLNDRYSLNNTWYESFNWSTDKTLYFRDIIGNKTVLDKCNINIGTIHSVKGAEADNVIVLTDVTKNVYKNIQKNGDSEHRVFYVGCTRAKNTLYLLQSSNKYEYKFMEG
jgi:DNA helicase-2/ATP-dependent DNA helicase PcrA